MTDTILVTGTFDLDPAKRDAAIAAFSQMMGATRAEDGCEQYVFSADVEDPGRFHLFEQWRDAASNDIHVTLPHFATFLTALGDLGVTGVSITKWQGATGEQVR